MSWRERSNPEKNGDQEVEFVATGEVAEEKCAKRSGGGRTIDRGASEWEVTQWGRCAKEICVVELRIGIQVHSEKESQFKFVFRAKEALRH